MRKFLSLSLCKSANEIFFHLQSILIWLPLQPWPKRNRNKCFTLYRDIMCNLFSFVVIPRSHILYLQYHKTCWCLWMEKKNFSWIFLQFFWISCALIIKTYNSFCASVLKVLKWFWYCNNKNTSHKPFTFNTKIFFWGAILISFGKST